MDSRQVKEILTNVISKSAEKAVSQGNYDKTILATIQYCMDKTSGQYRIKYQNGYYVAYGGTQDSFYSEGSSVFVLVPQGDFTKKLFITGSASNDSGDKVYLTNLEDDQKYKTTGPNVLINQAGANADFHMSSYWCGDTLETEYVKYYYQQGVAGNMFSIDDKAFQAFKKSEFFKLGVSFRTELNDSRKSSGDYGIRVVITFQSESTTYDKVYELNTFMMSGSPFNFSQYVPQSAYWNLSDEEGEMIGIKSIAGFVRLFPQATPPEDINFRDIFVSNISMQAAKQLYDNTNDIYRVNVISPDSFLFDTSKGYIDLTAELYVYGNLVQDNTSGIEYYWGKRDATVDNINNPHYCEQLGKGWYCFNDSTLVKSKVTSGDIQDLKNEGKVTVTPESADNYTKEDLAFISNQRDIKLSKTLCRAKETEIMCAVVYAGTTYYSEVIPVYNPEGLYLLIGAQDDQTTHYNELGYFTIAAGVFRDVDGESVPNNDYVLNENIKYKWVEHKNGIATELPITSPPDQILQSNSEWEPVNDGVHQDDETLTDVQVDTYLALDPTFEYCLERYNYYKNRADYYNRMEVEDRPEQWAIYVERCEDRRDAIMEGKVNEIYDKFDSNFVNDIGYYILGPSDVTAEYLEGGPQEYVNAKINSIVPRDSGSGSRPSIYNTVYKIPAAKINTQATYEVSAIMHDTSTNSDFGLGSKLITLVNEAGNSLDYYLEIVNGQQNFMYDERGISPTSDNAIQKIALQPLSFILYNKEGETLYNSANPEGYPNIDISDLHPVWKFHDSNYSLLLTNYQKPTDVPATRDDGMANTPKYATKADDFDTTHIWELANESYFYYKLREDYNNNYVNSSNVELQLIYGGSYIFGSTNFTFAKQGDLGTNGTNKSLSIYSAVYNNYKNNVLSDSKYCNFNIKAVKEDEAYDNNVRYYSPDERHLGKPYLFATNSYDNLASGSSPCSLRDGKYVNLYIAQSPVNNGEGIAQASAGSYQARWSTMTDQDTTSINGAKWTIPNETDANKSYNTLGWKTIGENEYYYEPSITLTSSTGPSIDIGLSRVSDDPALSYRPSRFDFTKDGHSGKHICNNILSVNAIMQAENERTISTYAYCTIPYYYINWTYLDSSLSGNSKLMPSYVDPARHIVIVGGFDQVVYNSDGKNPYYNGEPFRFYMFDKNGNDITYDVVQGAKAGTSSIIWSSSTGIRAINEAQVDNIPTFANVPDIINVGQLCLYNSKYYRCIYNHQKSISNVVEYGNGEKITYVAGSFIPAWWEETDVNTYYQSMQFVPCATYESLIENDLFNSWISLYIRHGVYEAEVFLPINVYCNCYESPELNAWDGKSLVMNDDGEYSYLIANKVSAGIKDEANRFVGISIGQNIRYEGDSGGSLTKKSQVGLFGFGYGRKLSTFNGDVRTKQTLFLDAETGLAAFGPSGSSQIILDPDNEHWSRLGGWYFSQNYLYKPVGENSDAMEATKYSSMASDDYEINPNSSQIGKSFGIYVPLDPSEVSDSTVAIWAGDGGVEDINNAPPQQAQFYVTYGGDLHATNAFIQGDIIATSGYFGSEDDKIAINPPKENPDDPNEPKYILKHNNFWVKNSDGGGDNGEVYIKGTIKACSGQIGNPDATNPDVGDALYIYKDYYPWVLPTDTQPWNDGTYYLDVNAGANTKYLLYHPNFSVDASGRAIFNGKIYSKEGRIGQWVINNNVLKTYNYDASTDTGTMLDGSNGNASFGTLDLYSTGAINYPNNTGKTWWITSAGEAHFTNTGNMFKAAEVDSAKVIVGKTIIQDGHGLYIDVGESLRIGNSASLTATTGSGFVFEGSATRFDCDLTIGANKTLGLQSGAQINVTSGLYLDSTGFHTHGAGGNYYWDQNGNAKTRTVSVGSAGTYYWDQNGDIYAHTLNAQTIMVGSDTLEAYIRSIISNVFNGDVVTNVWVGSTANVKDTDGNTQTVVKSISKSTKHI